MRARSVQKRKSARAHAQDPTLKTHHDGTGRRDFCDLTCRFQSYCTTIQYAHRETLTRRKRTRSTDVATNNAEHVRRLLRRRRCRYDGRDRRCRLIKRGKCGSLTHCMARSSFRSIKRTVTLSRPSQSFEIPVCTVVCGLFMGSPCGRERG